MEWILRFVVAILGKLFIHKRFLMFFGVCQRILGLLIMKKSCVLIKSDNFIKILYRHSIVVNPSGLLKLGFFIKIFILFLVINCSALGANKIQFFLGLGQSITSPLLTTKATNQMTKNTSSVNASGGYYYNQEQLADYEGSVKNITSLYVGAETTLDRIGIFTVRGFLTASYSNTVDFGSPHNVRNGTLRACNPNELPNLTNICYRDSFPTSQPGVTVPFENNPGFSNTITSNALMLSYGAGADIGFNIPISFIVEKLSGFKMIVLRLGGYVGGGYEFTSYSLGTYENRTYNNAMSATHVIKANDTFYAAGGGWFLRSGASIYIGSHLRFDVGIKMGFEPRESTKWYLRNSTQSGYEDSVFAQQLLMQSHSISMNSVWHFNVNMLF